VASPVSATGLKFEPHKLQHLSTFKHHRSHADPSTSARPQLYPEPADGCD
jgi:hypothetical protein